MTGEHADPSNREARLQEVLVACIEAAEAGGAVDREALLARYPEFAAELSEFFAARAGLERLAGPPRAHAPDRDTSTLARDDSALASLPADRVHYFGDYELLGELGRGGMGVVYRARQVSLNRTVALKMILAGQLANAEDVRRFHAEAEAAARLDHPGIVPVYEVGQQGGQHYFSMGFVEGESLAHKTARGLLPPREAAELTRTVAEAVAYAHAEGVIHRDLKPANILIDKHGKPRLTDFGLAKRVQSDTRLTATGQVLGTPSYMPPEQAGGRRGAVGPWSDVYSLGAVLYCLLTGRPPFQTDNPIDTLLQVLGEEPASPRQLNPAVPRDLETVCLKCLAKEPRKRYSSAQELAAELERFLDGRPIVARPVGSWGRLVRWARRSPVVAGLIALSVVLTVLGVAGIFWQWRGAEAARDHLALVAEAEADARAAAEQARQQEADARAKAVDERDHKARALTRAEGLRLTALSSAALPTNPSLALLLAIEGAQRVPGAVTNNALREALEKCSEKRTPVRSHHGMVSVAAFSPDGRRLLTAANNIAHI